MTLDNDAQEVTDGNILRHRAVHRSCAYICVMKGSDSTTDAVTLNVQRECVATGTYYRSELGCRLGPLEFVIS